MKRLLPLSLLLVPASAFAIAFTDVSDRYGDRKDITIPERAGVSVLTSIGAVSGNPDGTFAPDRTLNRAEFMKITLIAAERDSFAEGAEYNCFPDVKTADWFSTYVCTAKMQGIVEGNPDGTFHPERPVNYAEAIKILVELFEYDLPDPAPNERWAWYTGYWKAAEERAVLLPIDLDAGAELTRGQMARLTAAFVAEQSGQLSEYRLFEQQGRVKFSSSSSLSSGASQSTASSESSSSQSPSSSSAPGNATAYPATSSFLVASRLSPVLLDGLFNSPEDEAALYRVDLELQRKITSLESLVLVNPSGAEIATLKLQSYNNQYDTKWTAEILTGGYIFPKNTPVRLGIKAYVRSFGNGATSNELFELKSQSLSIRVTEKTSNNSRQIVPVDMHFPLHQTAFGRITSVSNELASSMTTPAGASRALGAFSVAGVPADGATLKLTSLTFRLDAIDVAVSNIRMGASSPVQQEGCSTELLDGVTYLTCPVPESMNNVSVSPTVLTVYGDVSVAAAKATGTVQLYAFSPGGINKTGVVQWTDGSGNFKWIEENVPLESGPMVTVTK